MPVGFYALSEQAERDTNDDFFAAESELGLFAVADGIGGRPGASSASRAAVASLRKRIAELPPAERLERGRLRETLAQVNADVIAVGERDARLAGLGTTLSALVVGEKASCLVHVGDSRVYRVRDGGITRLTRDHTVANELVILNRLRPEEVERHPLRGMLSRFLGSTSDAEPEIETFAIDPGECYLLATDGLSAVLPEEDILRICWAELPDGMEAVCRSLTAEALRRHPTDNVTLVALAVGNGVTKGAGAP